MGMASERHVVRRGSESWEFIRWFLAIALGVELTLILSLEASLSDRVFLSMLVGGLTYRLCMNNGWVQNKIVGIKVKYETKWR